MTRRIIYLLLAIVVVLVVVLGIRWWLNRGGDTVVDEVGNEISEVVDDVTSGTPVVDLGSEEGATDTAPGDTTTGETPAAPGTTTTDETAVTAEATPVAGEGEMAPTETTDMNAGTGTAEATAPEGSTAGEGEAIAVDPSLGGVPDSNDANVGGGVVEPGPADTSAATDSSGGEAAAPSTDSSAAAGGTGGQLPQFNLVVQGQPVQHTVQNNEWLTQLARCYGTTVQDIQAANNYSCPDLIHPGWVVNINNPGNAGPITINEMPCFSYYTVQQGDNLYRVAEQFGIHFQWLARINAIYNYDYVQVGQMLVIPNPVPAEMTTAPAQPYYYSACWGYGCVDPWYGYVDGGY